MATVAAKSRTGCYATDDQVAHGVPSRPGGVSGLAQPADADKAPESVRVLGDVLGAVGVPFR